MCHNNDTGKPYYTNRVDAFGFTNVHAGDPTTCVLPTGTITTTLHRNPTATVVSINLVNGVLETVNRMPSMLPFQGHPPIPMPDLVWKEIYRAVDGEVRLVEVVKGRIIPATTTPEQYVFDNETENDT